MATKKPTTTHSEMMESALTEAMAKCDELSYVDFEQEDPENAMIIRSGIQPLDWMLGGGLRGGRMTEIFGPNKSAKTEIVRAFSENFLTDYPDSKVWYYDQEFALNEAILRKYPVFKALDPSGRKRFASFRADTMEVFFSVLFKSFKAAIQAGATRIPLLIVLDSFPALRPKVEIESDDFAKVIMMAQARISSECLPKLRGFLAKTGVHFMIVNQTRDKPNQPAFVEQESPGGNAIKFYSDYRLITKPISRFSFSKGKNLEAGTRQSGFFTRVRIRKNKLGIPDRDVEIPITYMDACGDRSGASDMWCIFYTLTTAKIITARGGKFVMKGMPETFDRTMWPEIYRQCIGTNRLLIEGSPLHSALSIWRDRQFSPDFVTANSGEVEDNNSDNDDDNE